jgi:transcriptional regulator with XRE-family HTH domain
VSVLHRVREVRISRGMTQAELASLIDMERCDISRLERHIRDPRLSTLRAIAKALKATLDELVA